MLLAAGLFLAAGCSREDKSSSQAAALQKPAASKATAKPGAPREPAELDYPATRRGDVVDNYHGVNVADPYRWLEDADSNETLEWVEKQNELTERFLSRIPARKRIEQRLTELLNYERYSTPYKQGGWYFFWKNDGLQNQSVLYRQKTLDGPASVVINPNLLSKDGTVAIGSTAVSEDGAYLAYGISRSGSDEQQVRIRNIETGKDLPEVLNWCRFTSIAWKHDASGFYYNRFPDPNKVAPQDVTNYNRVYWHRLGTARSEDVLVYGSNENKELGFAPFITEDGKFLLLYVYHGTDPRNGIYYRRIGENGEFSRLFELGDAEYDFIGNSGTVFYFNTDKNAGLGRIVKVDVGKPEPELETLIGESEDVIDYAGLVGGRFVVAYMSDVHHKLRIFDLQGDFVKELKLPTVGTVGGLSGKQDQNEMFFSFTSFLFPTTSYRYDFANGSLTVFKQPQIAFDASAYETKQVFCKSKDGTRVPMFITYKKGLKLDGNNPTLLYGYGGFNISIRPSFSTSAIVWLETGGVYAVANMRGGGEYGEPWHRAGMLDKKQNVFDDFIAAAEWLVANGYTSTDKLVIKGGSNGGLLVAACMLQRPDLYGAVVCQVPVIDMLRYHKFTVGRYWIPEYGNAEADKEQFDYLYAYSPLHNVEQGREYPPILITSADTDDRVVPMHSKKFAATLQAKAGGDNPILLRVETKAGHGAGKPITKTIEEQADIFAFLYETLGVDGN